MKQLYYKKNLVAFIFFMLYFSFSILAQSNFRYDAELITPSADSWNMIKYGSVGASLYTGTANVSIPFYTYKDKDFTIPISFDYASNGHIPNKKAGILGPDWILNVGGTISVEINGIPDYSININGNPGFFYLSKNESIQSKDVSKLFRFVNLDYSITTGMHSPYILYCPDGFPNTPGRKYDSEPDLYNFNFMGYSGSFHRGYGDTTYIYNTNTNNQDFRIQFAENFSYIYIITSDGYKYEFNTSILNSDFVEDADRKLRVAWKLSKIVAPNGRVATFHYSSYFNSNCQPNSIDVTGQLTQLDYGGSNIQDIGQQWEHNIMDMVKTNMILDSITIIDGPIIDFDYTQLSADNSDEFAPISFPGIPTIKESHRLIGISVVSPSNTLLKECSLSYKNNNTGKRINYLASANISGEGVFQMDYHNWNNSSYPFPGNGTLSVDHWGYYNGKNNDNSFGVPFLKLGYISNGSLVITSTARDADSSFAKTGMLKKLTYPTGGYSLLDYESHDYSVAFKRQNVYTMISESGVCGGLRIKSISNYNSDGVIYDSRSFEYTNGTNSSGILLHFPVYYVEYSAYTVGGISEDNIKYYSSGIFSYGSTHIEYSKVTELHSDNSKVVYNFTNSTLSNNYSDDVHVIDVVNEPFYSILNFWIINNNLLVDLTAPISSKQSERGNLLSKEVFSTESSTAPIYIESNTYNSGVFLSKDYLPAYLIRKFGYYVKFIDNYKLTGQTTKENRNGTEVIKHTKYNYNSYGQAVRVATRDSKGDSIITKYQYVKDLSAAQITPSSVYRSMLDSNVIGYPLSEMVYIKKSGIGSEIQISGKRYTYINPVSTKKAIIKLSKVELYDNSTSGWYTEVIYTSFDSKGNILESWNRNNIYTSYVWGYNGLYLVAKIDNIRIFTLKNSVSGLSGISDNPLTGAIVSGIHSTLRASHPNSLATLYDYNPFVGLSKVNDPSGKVINYDYNSSGKLNSIKDSKNLPQNTIFYSPDNKL